MTSGIYMILDSKGRAYIGSSCRIEMRFKEHIRSWKRNAHLNIKMQNVFNKYGINHFSFSIIEICENLIEREQFYIDSLNPWFNICRVAAKPPSWKGKKHTERTIEKIKSSRWNHSEETMKKLRKIWDSPEHKAKISGITKQSRAFWVGTPHTEEHKKRVGDLHRGKIVSMETRQKLREANIGKKASDQSREKMSKSQKGRKHTPETIERLKLAAVKRFENPEYRAKQLLHLRKLSDLKIKHG